MGVHYNDVQYGSSQPVGGTQGDAVVTSITPAATSTTAVHAGFAGNDPSNNFPGPFTNPDVARTATVTFGAAWDGGTVTLTGTDPFGNPQTEAFVPGAGSTVQGTKIWKTITSATKGAVGASANTASIGTGATIGPFVDRDEILVISAVNLALTLELPALAAMSAGRRLAALKSDSGFNAITVDGKGAETLGSAGDAAKVISGQDDLIEFIPRTASIWTISGYTTAL